MACSVITPALGLQVYIYTLDADTNQYNLSQTLSGNSSSVTGFGTDIGQLSCSGSPVLTRPLHQLRVSGDI